MLNKALTFMKVFLQVTHCEKEFKKHKVVTNMTGQGLSKKKSFDFKNLTFRLLQHTSLEVTVNSITATCPFIFVTAVCFLFLLKLKWPKNWIDGVESRVYLFKEEFF